jgi:endonuclease III
LQKKGRKALFLIIVEDAMSLEERIIECIELLRKATQHFEPTLTTSLILDFGRDPYLILISCLLSLRAKDTVTYPVSKKLFQYAKTPEEMVVLSRSELETIVYPLGFYKVKAQRVQEVSQELLSRFHGKVPSTEDELLSLKGVGRKTANLVLGAAFGVPSLCVDTHVHRIANRLGWIATKTAHETEIELKKVVPKKYWNEVNTLLVLWGQNICVPLSPRCSVCVLSPLCPKIGVTRSR